MCARLRTPFLLAGSLLLLPGLAIAQYPLPATLGIYDDPEMTRSSGSMTGETKSLYVGFKLPHIPYDSGYTGLEFSIQGLHDLDFDFEFEVEPVVVLGSVAAPVDPGSGTGGLAAAWNGCFPGDRVVATLTLQTTDPPPADRVLRIARTFQSWTDVERSPSANGCNACISCYFHLVSVDYTLNPTVAVQPRSWSRIKALFVDAHTTGPER